MKPVSHLLLAFAPAIIPQWLWACPVCFGEGGSNLSRGFFWGILILLLLPAILVLTIAAKIVRATRRKASSSSIQAA